MSSSLKGRRLSERILITPKKRVYAEFVFDTEKDESGNRCKRKPGRRGPLNDSTIRSIETVKQEGGACWRCKMLKKPVSCDGRSPCTQCSNKNSTLWQIGCHRGNLHDQLKDKFPHIPGLGSDEWFLSNMGGDFTQVRLKYHCSAIEIHDLDVSGFRARPEPHSKDSRRLQDFLEQFHDMRWGIRGYPHLVLNQRVITLCAQIQWDLISKTSLPLSKWSDSSLLIAMALRPLAYTQKYAVVAYGLSFMRPLDSSSQPKSTRVNNYSIEVQRCPVLPEFLSRQSGPNCGGQLSAMIQDIVRVTQRLLLKRNPADWPCILCVLILYRVMIASLRLFSPWVHPFHDALLEMKSVWSALCQLYQICTKGNHPLVDKWNFEEYASLVGNNRLAGEHFRSLHDIWVKINGSRIACVGMDLEKKIEDLAFKGDTRTWMGLLVDMA